MESADDATATAELVRRARRGDADAFCTLIRRFERTALAIAFGCCEGDAAAAADVTQEAFVRAWQKLAELKDAGRFGPWLGRLVRNLAVDAKRKGRRFRPAMTTDDAIEAAGDASGDPAAAIERREESEKIAAALRELDDESRTVVVLRYFENLPSVQIAELIGSTPAAVDMRLSRARRTLRGLLEDELCAPSPSVSDETQL